jgi:hypothetical protein
LNKACFAYITNYYRPAEGLEGAFRFQLAGTEHLTVKIPVSLFLPFEDLYDLELQGQFLPGHHVTLQPNSTSSTWVDVEELINSQDVDVFDKEGRPCHERVFARLASAREENPHLGNDPYLTL